MKNDSADLKNRIARDLVQFASQVCHDTEHSAELNRSHFTLYPEEWQLGRIRSHIGEGNIVSSRTAEDIIDKLQYDLMPVMKKIGENQINQRIDTAIWDVVDCTGKRGGTIEKRAEKSANEILDIPQNLKKYTIWVQIVGLHTGQEAEFGGIQFGVDDKEKQWFHHLLHLDLLNLEEKQLARTSVLAYTEESAYSKGYSKIRDAVQALGIFKYTDDGYNNYRQYRPGVNEYVCYGWCSNNSEQGYMVRGVNEWKNVDLRGLRLKNLMSNEIDGYHWYRKAAWELSRIIAKDEKTECETAIVRSMVHLGNSQTTEDPTMSVLNVIVGAENLACEQLITKGRKSKTIKFVVDIVNQGAEFEVARIKFEGMRDFQKIGSIMHDLYELRNDIVHKAKVASGRDQTKARSMGQHIADMYLIWHRNNIGNT